MIYHTFINTKIKIYDPSKNEWMVLREIMAAIFKAKYHT